MKYRNLAGENVSVLGFGCMRFPLTSKDAADIDYEKSAQMINYAIDNGVNYFDTTYVYHNEKSEGFLGKALGDRRKDVFIATKCPPWVINAEEDFDKVLNEQLERLGTDYIDFYLMHALDKSRFDNVVLKFNLLDKLKAAKDAGKIRHIGFSFHDDLETFKRIIDYTDLWEFCQIQLNYINTEYQAGLEGLEYANKKGLGVIIMEPLLGGRLANPNKFVREVLPDTKSSVEWAFDFLWNRKEVCLTLSGMGEMEQVKSNIGYASSSETGMLNSDDLEMLKRAKAQFEKYAFVPCTKCAYCMPCPFGVDIPKIFELYNASASQHDMDDEYKKLNTLADKCRKCKACERACPQGIKITEELEKAHKRLTQ